MIISEHFYKSRKTLKSVDDAANLVYLKHLNEYNIKSQEFLMRSLLEDKRKGFIWIDKSGKVASKEGF